MKRAIGLFLALAVWAPAAQADDGGWKSIQITFSHRRVDNETTEIDWHTERSAASAKEASEALSRRQAAINQGRIAQRTLHYKDQDAIAQLQKEAR